MSRLSVVIVNYRSGELLKSCLASLFENSNPADFEVIVVNNDSSCDLGPVASSNWPRVRVIQNTSNLGYAAAANIAFHEWQREFVLVLNPDILVKPHSVEALLNTLQTHAQAGIALPQLSNPDGSLQYSCRKFYTYTTLLMRRSPLGRIFPSHRALREHLMTDWNHQELAEVDWGLGAAMMVRRSAIEEPYLFDERFFLYFEDVDLCVRMRRRGWKVLYNPEAKMIHQHRRQSAQSWAHPTWRHHFVSLMRFLWKYRLRL